MTLGQILPDESVGVLVGAPLPAMVRRGEVELHLARRFDLRVAVEFGPVVGGDRLELSGVPPHQRQRRLARFEFARASAQEK